MGQLGAVLFIGGLVCMLIGFQGGLGNMKGSVVFWIIILGSAIAMLGEAMAGF